jgi:glycosyltransferase involved in cell wall biosynthesis
MLPLVIYIHDFRTSGVVRDSMKLAAHCSMHFPVTLVAGHRVGYLEGEARSGGYEVVSLPAAAAGSTARVLASLQLRRWLRRHGPCVLLSMGNMGHATAYLACRGLDHVKRVYRISNEIARNDGLRGAVRSLWMRLLIDDAERMPLVGATLAANPLFAGALRSGVAIEMNSGVDIVHARAMAAAPVPHPWLEEEIPVVLGIGRLRPQKNFGLLIDAMAIVRAERQMRLAIIGGGSRGEHKALAERAARAGLGADFLLAGETQNVFSWLGRSRVFVLPSRWEGSSVALLEAMAIGVPVVASLLAGDASQVLEGGRWGRLFDGLSAEALAEGILLQASGLAVRAGDRVLAYSEPWNSYRALLEPLLRGA